MSAEKLIKAASLNFLHARNPQGLEFIRSLSGLARVWPFQLKKNLIIVFGYIIMGPL